MNSNRLPSQTQLTLDRVADGIFLYQWNAILSRTTLEVATSATSASPARRGRRGDGRTPSFGADDPSDSGISYLLQVNSYMILGSWMHYLPRSVGGNRLQQLRIGARPSLEALYASPHSRIISYRRHQSDLLPTSYLTYVRYAVQRRRRSMLVLDSRP